MGTTPNPDPANITVPANSKKIKKIEVFPTGDAPPSGTIKAFGSGSYADGQAFSIYDGSGSHTDVQFLVTTLKPSSTSGPPYPIYIAPGSTATQVGMAIASAVNQANQDGKLYIEANAEPVDGRVYLTYDFTKDQASDGNGVVITDDGSNPMPSGSISSWIPGKSQSQGSSQSNDIRNVQWAIENVDDEGTVVLKRCAVNTSTATSFDFGKIGRVKLNKSVTLQGECEITGQNVENRREVNSDGTGGWVLAGTTIDGGTQMVVGEDAQVNYHIRDIIFNGFYAGAVRVKQSTGPCEISGCQFRNFIQGRVVRKEPVLIAGISGAFPIVVDGGLTASEADFCAGTLKVVNNWFGAPVEGKDPKTPKDKFNNLMHFDDCNLDLTISGNEIDDCVWCGFAVWGNKGFTRITNNTIRKTGSYFEGSAIGIGMMVFRYDSKDPKVYTGPSEVKNNRITVKSPNSKPPNSAAIAIAAYPRDLAYYLLSSTNQTHVISNNKIQVENAQAVLACRGDCSYVSFVDNQIIKGSAKVGIWVTRSLPTTMAGSVSLWVQLPAGDLNHPAHNVFKDNNLTGFTASIAQVLLDDTQDNSFKNNSYGEIDGATTLGLAGAYIRHSTGNTFHNEDFFGDYPGIMDETTNPPSPLPVPRPCMWFTVDSGANTVEDLLHNDAPVNVCNDVFCEDKNNNDIHPSYATCQLDSTIVGAMQARGTFVQGASGIDWAEV